MSSGKKKRYPIAPMSDKGGNMDEGPPMLVSEGYSVLEWVPHRVGEGDGKPTALLLVNHVKLGDTSFDIAMRVKSRAEAERLITILGAHMNNIWPEKGGPS